MKTKKMPVEVEPIEAMAAREVSCQHIEECKASTRVLYHMDDCRQCRIATKFRT